MAAKVGIYRHGRETAEAVSQLQELREQYRQVSCPDKSQTFNTSLVDILELGNLLDNALISAASALNRQESRGAHARKDFPERNDSKWLKHTLAWLDEDKVKIGYKSVNTWRWQPQPRKY